MLKRLRPPIIGAAGWLVVSLWLAACGSEAEATPPVQAPTAPAQTEPVAAAPTEVTPTEQAAPPETAATEQVAAAPTSAGNSPAASNQAVCQAVEVPGNDLIAPVSADDWSKGPAAAAVTLIEYGDFQ